MNKARTITLRITDRQLKDIDSIAETAGVKRSAVIRKSLKYGIEKCREQTGYWDYWQE